MIEKLIEMCRKEKREAQRQLYEMYDARMFRVVFRYVKEVQEAEDVVLNGFYKVFTHISRFEYRGPDSLEKWIRRIMVNEALMSLRKSRMYLSDESEADKEESVWEADTDLDAEAIYALIRQLPDGYRMVFNLFVIEGFSHAEIAEKLEITEGTSRSQLSKARTQLKEWLTQNDVNNLHAEYGKVH